MFRQLVILVVGPQCTLLHCVVVIVGEHCTVYALSVLPLISRTLDGHSDVSGVQV